MPPTDEYLLSVEDDSRSLLERIADQLPCGPIEAVRRENTYLDTFDWRLERAGTELVFVDDGKRRELRWCARGGRLRRATPRFAPPAFADDLGPGCFADTLKTIVGIRRLLPRIQVERTGFVRRILGPEAKTVCRVAVWQRRVADAAGERRPLDRIVEIETITGYSRARARALEVVAGHLGPVPDREIEVALEAFDRHPGDYRSKPPSPVERGMRADTALRTFLGQLAEIIERNRAGTCDDLDIEFLHDLRVAVRRTRSALSQLKGVLPATAVAPFTSDFRWLGSATGPCRDLDVLSLEIGGHLEALDAADRRSVAPLVAHLRVRRGREQARIAEALTSERYHHLMERWRAFLHADLEATSRGHAAVEAVAAGRLRKLAKRLAHHARTASDLTPVAELHAIRIDAKKLRYLLELFQPLLPAKAGRRLIKRLKEVQDHLGGWHDREQQQSWIEALASEMARESQVPTQTLLSIGRLLAHLEGVACLERRQVAASLGTLIPCLAAPGRHEWLPRTESST